MALAIPVRRYAQAWWLLVPALTLLGAVLRFAWLGSQPLWFDEQQQVNAAASPAVLEVIRSHAAAAPLDYMGTRLMLVLGLPVRWWPALVGTATIPLLYLAGRKWFDERTGLLAALLLAVAPFHVYYSGEARFYALSTLLTVASLLAFRTRWLAPVVALILYTHYFAVIVPLGLVVIHRTEWRPFGVGVLLWLPWALYALPTQMAYQHELMEGLSTVPTCPLVAQLIAPDFDVSGLPWIVPAALLGLTVAMLRPTWLVGLAVVAIALTGLATWLDGYFWSPRQVLFVLPLLFIEMARRPAWMIGAWAVLCIPFIDGVTGADAWQPRTESLD